MHWRRAIASASRDSELLRDCCRTNANIRLLGLLQTNISPAAMAPVVREALRVVDPDLPLVQPQALATRIALTLADRKLAPGLLAGFAALALVLASPGVYRVMAYLVAFRTREIGLRKALGASSGSVMRIVLAHGRRLTLAGIAHRIVGPSPSPGRCSRRSSKPRDPLVYLALSVMLLRVAECAAWLPAPRANENRFCDCAAARVSPAHCWCPATVAARPVCQGPSGKPLINQIGNMKNLRSICHFSRGFNV
jgi:hypothetical protein